ncbi:MAG: hypothetical protein LC792_15235, partial [Actinobacteria bacterium]|nr:hypothetical protein [Actinomycetota bacterium]
PNISFISWWTSLLLMWPPVRAGPTVDQARPDCAGTFSAPLQPGCNGTATRWVMMSAVHPRAARRAVGSVVVDRSAAAMGPASMKLVPRPVAGSVAELLAGATSRQPMPKSGDSLSGARFERVVIGGERFVLKHLHVDDDWVMRATGDVRCRPLLAWRSGLLDALPPTLDHAVVGCAEAGGRNGWGAAVLQRDVGPWLVPEGDGPLPLDQHHRFLEHMADLHAAFWRWRDTVALLPMANRYSCLTPAVSDVEAELGSSDAVPPMIAAGWRRVDAAAPRAAGLARALIGDTSPLLDPLAGTPQTLVHSDWKAGNLGTLPDGRTVLLDWAFPGEAPACADMAWYLAVNCDRLPEPKEQAIGAYRGALEARGIDTVPWWDAQLALCLIGAFLQLGWSKAGPELVWWEQRVLAGASYLS